MVWVVMAKAKTLYETLGIVKGANGVTVKRAYRARARKAHPDKGGSESEMAELNRAYEILIDPVKRLAYDEAGVEDSPAPESKAAAGVVEIFKVLVLERGVETNIVEEAINLVKSSRKECGSKQHDALTKVERLTRIRDRVRLKGKHRDGSNLFHSLVDGQVKDLKAYVAKLDLNLAEHDAILALLAEYKSCDPPQGVRVPAINASTTTAGFVMWSG